MGEIKMKKEIDERKILKGLAKYGLLLFALLLLTFTAFYTIQAGYRGVLLTFGKPSMNAIDEGLHLKIPIAQTIKKMEVRKQKIEVTADSASKDLQDVMTTIALNFHLSASQVPKLYQEIGKDYSDRIINPAIQESVKATTAKFTAEELITRRPEVRDSIKNFITEKLKKYYIVVDDFNIVNFQFSEEFDKAIEAKVTAEQLKLKAEMDLERIKVEKEQKITQAQAEAEALRIQKQQITSELIKLRQIEMMMAAIGKWDGKMPEATAGMPFIDITPSSMGIE